MAALDVPGINDFDPCAERARAIGARMQARLADSLRYIAGQMQDAGLAVPDLTGVLKCLADGPVSPLLFGAYCDLVLALETDARTEAEQRLAEIAHAPNVADGPAIFDLAHPDSDAASNRYWRLVDTDVSMPIAIRPPSAEDAARVRGLIEEAFALLDAGHRALAGEIRELVREIVLATGPEDPKAPQFDGVSSFMLWGGVVLNVTSYKTVLELVQALAHESGHNLLFGLCAYGPLQENPETERYASPLRTDARPMDGITHATYVAARMHQAVQRLIDSGILNGSQLVEARKAIADNAKWFAGGMETVDRHARLTPLGKEIMENARDYMAPYLPLAVTAP
jgi:HEXXH motif-containing protein